MELMPGRKRNAPHHVHWVWTWNVGKSQSGSWLKIDTSACVYHDTERAPHNKTNNKLVNDQPNDPQRLVIHVISQNSKSGPGSAAPTSNLAKC